MFYSLNKTNRLNMTESPKLEVDAEHDPYDFIFNTDADIKSDARPEHNSRPEILNERQRLIYAPLESNSVSLEVAQGEENEAWDAILLSEEDFVKKYSKTPPVKTVERAAVRNESHIDRSVTEESVSFSRKILEGKLDPRVMHIVAEYAPNAANIEELIDTIRNNAELRLALAELFLNKIDNNIGSMPERIVRNGQKKPNHLGYKHLQYISTREYAALIALSMLDGTFKEAATKADGIRMGDDGKPVVGQHRYAAELLLK
jgi:hypothetical protein